MPQPPQKPIPFANPPNPKPHLPPAYEILIQCQSESHQKRLYNRLRKEGHPCKLFTQ